MRRPGSTIHIEQMSDKINPKGTPPLWPDKNGMLNTAGIGTNGPRESFWRRWLHWPHAKQSTISAGRSSRSSYLWRRVKWLLTFSFQSAQRANFETWLIGKLEDSPYGCEHVMDLVSAAVDDLGIEPERAVRLLVHVTADGARFKSDGGLISRR